MTDELIASLMELQEKLHMGLGRNRKKVAIGVHNFEPVKPPFTYKGVDPDIVQFVPLNKVESMTLRQILKNHEKGVNYANLLEGFDKHPLIVDVNNNVLSYPPIINSSLTEVTPFTTNLFIDVTGNDQKAINYALNIVVTALAERGGQPAPAHLGEGVLAQVVGHLGHRLLVGGETDLDRDALVRPAKVPVTVGPAERTRVPRRPTCSLGESTLVPFRRKM
jgi:phenylalanyl-tRNA synthetase beta subunit